MKKLLVILVIVLLPVAALAEPWLVCTPQSDATGYIYTLNAGTEVVVPYKTQVIGGVTYAVIADCAAVPNGSFTYQVKAYKDDATWGRLVSATVPFTSSRPSLGGVLGLAIKR